MADGLAELNNSRTEKVTQLIDSYLSELEVIPDDSQDSDLYSKTKRIIRFLEWTKRVVDGEEKINARAFHHVSYQFPITEDQRLVNIRNITRNILRARSDMGVLNNPFDVGSKDSREILKKIRSYLGLIPVPMLVQLRDIKYDGTTIVLGPRTNPAIASVGYNLRDLTGVDLSRKDTSNLVNYYIAQEFITAVTRYQFNYVDGYAYIPVNNKNIDCIAKVRIDKADATIPLFSFFLQPVDYISLPGTPIKKARKAVEAYLIEQATELIEYK